MGKIRKLSPVILAGTENSHKPYFFHRPRILICREAATKTVPKDTSGNPLQLEKGTNKPLLKSLLRPSVLISTKELKP